MLQVVLPPVGGMGLKDLHNLVYLAYFSLVWNLCLAKKAFPVAMA
ncbi:hypothetical protein LX99_00069 [Mucilaginibacter oryzae]|uniref:Uncharacterized protein n=1 Tax=Mucilaginibacter oryzae TaxID=468058 RepID=A0A316HX86_9SPHI|nr:hypothetical protein LX99_00069 [Mucilaginibacter oryzae]